MKLSYLASLPERIARAAAATAGGAVYQSSEVLLPRWLRGSHLYKATVARMLRVTIELVGGVNGVLPPDAIPVRELALRKTAGNVLELASFLAVGWSPLWLLAAASDATGGTRTYLRALVEELKQSALLPSDVQVASFGDLLDKVEQTSGVLADTIDVPPVNIRDARATWQALRQHATELPGPEGLAEIFANLQRAAKGGGRPLLDVSSAVAVGAMRAGLKLGNTHIFEYYQQALNTILQEGFPAYVRRVARPYLMVAARHLDPKTPSYTQRVIGWARDRWRRVRRQAPGP